jgi:hypothetical protein
LITSRRASLFEWRTVLVRTEESTVATSAETAGRARAGVPTQIRIDGECNEAAAGETIEKISAVTETVPVELAAGGAAGIDGAIGPLVRGFKQAVADLGGDAGPTASLCHREHGAAVEPPASVSA